MLKWLAGKFEQGRGALQSKLENQVNRQSPPPPFFDAEGWRKRGNDWVEADNLVEAERCYQEAVNLAPTDVAALVNLGFVKAERKATQEAQQLLRRALLLDSTNMDAWYILGGIHEQDGHPTAAAEAFQKAIELRPD